MSFSTLGLIRGSVARGCRSGVHRPDTDSTASHSRRPCRRRPTGRRADRDRQDRRVRPADAAAAVRQPPRRTGRARRPARSSSLPPASWRRRSKRRSRPTASTSSSPPWPCSAASGSDRRRHNCGAASTSWWPRPAGCSIISARATSNFSRVEIFVLDEADRMLDMGFIPDVKRVLAALPKQRQNLLFSATFSRRDQVARRNAARPAAHDRSDAAQLDRRHDRAARASGQPRREEQAPRLARRPPPLAAGAGVHADQARRGQAGALARERRHPRGGAARQQEPGRAHARARPTSRRAASR